MEHPDLRKFYTNSSIESAVKPPVSWYVDQDFLDYEQGDSQYRGWYFAGSSDSIPEPGYLSPNFLPFPTLITREGNSLLAFHNACLHHRSEVGEGTGTKLSCPYHGWVYNLDGKLKSTPHLKERPNCLRDAGLTPMKLLRVGPLLFVNPNITLDSLAMDYIPVGSLTTAYSAKYPLNCNWKIYVENYLDGGYHVPILHRDLTRQLNLNSYEVQVEDGYVLQSVTGGSGDFQERIGSGAFYFWFYPNLMVNIYGPWVTTLVVAPNASTYTTVEATYYLDSALLNDQDFIYRSIKASTKVTQEDIRICESVQKNMSTLTNFRSVYVPKFEKGMYYFHQLLAKELKGD